LGEGHTSVAIANEKIYITGMHGDRLILYVFDMNGKLLTEKEIGKEWNRNHNGTRSSVCINDGKLYIFNALGTLFCLDETTLNAVWTKDLLSDFDGRNIMFGITENPLIVGDKIFMTPGGVKDNMVAMNKHTGELIWSSPGIGEPSSHCSPLFIGDQSVPMVVTCFEYDIVAFNAETGEVLWRRPQLSENDLNPNIPIYHDGMILSVTGYRGGAWLYRLTDGGKDAKLVWHNKEMDNQMGSAIRAGDYIYASGHQASRSWFCVDWKTGETKYQVRDIGPANVIFADGMLYVYSERDGTMNLVKPNPDKFELVSSFDVVYGTGPHWAHPVILNGVLYIRHGDALMAYKIK
jgi:outer membrane protein assembly factor BamB